MVTRLTSECAIAAVQMLCSPLVVQTDRRSVRPDWVRSLQMAMRVAS